MQIRWNRFEATLSKTTDLARCYVFYGDEACLQMELRDTLIRRLKQEDFERETPYNIDTATASWDKLNDPFETLSLFSSRTLIDIRVNTEKLPAEGAKWLATLPQRWHEDIIVILSLPKLDKAALGSAWFKGLEQAHTVMVATPSLDQTGFKEWIELRAARYNFSIKGEVLSQFIDLMEGNLFAARQLLERLWLSGHQGTVKSEDLSAYGEQSARYELQQLSEAWLSNDKVRCLEILSMMRQEDDGMLILILWQLGEDIHAWWALSQNKTAVMLWGARKIAVEKRLRSQRLNATTFTDYIRSLAELDQAVKGLVTYKGNLWNQLEKLLMTWTSPIKTPQA